MMLIRFVKICILLVIVSLAISSCRKGPVFTTDASDKLSFSVDTLTFDTVFTEMGSATRLFKVFNNNDKAIKIDRIELAGGSQSFFNINVDGDPITSSIRDVEIRAKDSLYIFANVTVDPNNMNSPLVVFDSILFETNGNDQSVVLEAWGQDAVYIGQRGFLTRFSNLNVNFTNEKPYVLFGVIVIDSSSILTIDRGTRVHMFGGPTSRPGDRALLLIGENSTLEVNGTQSEPVKFLTHRLEEDFQDLPFQWEGIFLSKNSLNNKINYAEIRNSIIGVLVDSLSVNPPNRKLELTNSFIYNVDLAGMVGIEGDFYVENSVIANSNGFNLLMIKGGDYDLNHCTLVNYASNVFIGRNEPIIQFRNYQVITQDLTVEGEGDANFTNCIIYGSRNEEVEIDLVENPTTSLSYKFENCLIKTDTFSTGQINCLTNLDPLFMDIDDLDFHLDTIVSPAVDAGKTGIGIPLDFDQKIRDANPDIGAFEFEE